MVCSRYFPTDVCILFNELFTICAENIMTERNIKRCPFKAGIRIHKRLDLKPKPHILFFKGHIFLWLFFSCLLCVRVFERDFEQCSFINFLQKVLYLSKYGWPCHCSRKTVNWIYQRYRNSLLRPKDEREWLLFWHEDTYSSLFYEADNNKMRSENVELLNGYIAKVH